MSHLALRGGADGLGMIGGGARGLGVPEQRQLVPT